MKLKTVRFISGGLVVPLTLLSLVAALFLSWSGLICGAVAFGLAIACLALTGKERYGWKLQESGWKRSVLFVVMTVVFTSAAVLVLSARTTGVCKTVGLPVFANREHYFLTNHGAMTEVSRLRFLFVGTSFVTGWHSLILLAGLWCFFQPGESSANSFR